jgi:pseudouridylate synthase / pseudouridine kinase
MGLLYRTIVPFGARRPHQILKKSSISRGLVTNNSFFRVSEEVREALHTNKPVVALETTIYTHGILCNHSESHTPLIVFSGFPYPDNVALASHLESVVRTNGGVPATIGIVDGIARVGLSPEELIKLTSSAGSANTLKLSRRDLSYVCGSRLVGKSYHGGTTIAGTMILAQMAGIKVFGTGGLGGVHRGAESSMDISADLTELGRTNVAVVSSGCKSFLDIPRTLEYLETEGVTVATFRDGREGKIEFPAFWSRNSGVPSPMVVEDEKHAASIICRFVFCAEIYLSLFSTTSSGVFDMSLTPPQMPSMRSKYLPVSISRIHAQKRLQFRRKRLTTLLNRPLRRPKSLVLQAMTTRRLSSARSRN